jgi:hypothetical protein
MPCNASLANVSDWSADVQRPRDGNAVSSAICSNARQPGAGSFPLPEGMVRCVNNAAEDSAHSCTSATLCASMP